MRQPVEALLAGYRRLKLVPTIGDLDPEVIYGIAPAAGDPAARVTTPQLV